MPGKGDGKITVRVEKNNTNNVTLTVEDNDIGIKPEKPEKLFQKFYQIDGATKRHVGHRAWFGDMQRHSRSSRWESMGR